MYWIQWHTAIDLGLAQVRREPVPMARDGPMLFGYNEIKLDCPRHGSLWNQ